MPFIPSIAIGALGILAAGAAQAAPALEIRNAAARVVIVPEARSDIDIKVPAGHVTSMRARISGSGEVSFGGDAQSLQALVSGSGDIHVGAVKGEVEKHVSGSGEVHIGP